MKIVTEIFRLKRILQRSLFLRLREAIASGSICGLVIIAAGSSFRNKKRKLQLKQTFIISIMMFLLPLLNEAGKSFSQVTSRKDKQLILKADKAFDFGDYLTALKLYEKLFLL